MTFEGDNQVMIFLAVRNLGATSERSLQWAQKIIYHIRNLAIMCIGIKDGENDLGRGQVDGLKKRLKTSISQPISLLFNGEENLPVSLTTECLYTTTSARL